MNFLLDTNIIIPLEPVSASDIESGSNSAMRLFNIAQEVGAGIFIHPQQARDIEQDTNTHRREQRQIHLQKYRSLVNPPPLTVRVREAANWPVEGSNSWIDAHIIAALDQSAADYLVTNDEGIHRICRKLQLEARCLKLDAALDLLLSERIIVPVAPPAIVPIIAYELDARDPIFDGLRADYTPFDEWLEKCKREHRNAWIIKRPGESGYAGVCIVNREDRGWDGAVNPTLKICTFKIADGAKGAKLGELLLRAIFTFAHENSFKTLFVEVYPKHGALLHLMRQFGFEETESKHDSGELVLRKRLAPTALEDEQMKAHDYAKMFGPYSVKWEGSVVFIIPIEPRFHELLFPEMEQQGSLLAGQDSFGNTLIKAYLCRAQTRSIQPGDIVLFYRSGDQQAITTLGVVEETLATDNADKMANFLRSRTVYLKKDILTICSSAEALGITFRHAPILKRHIPLSELISNQLLSKAPQSISKLPSRTSSWLKAHL